MERRTRISVALVVVALLAGALVAAAVRPDDEDEAPRADAVARAQPGAPLSLLATSREYELWSSRGCITCHGPEARGSSLGPDLTKVVPRYLAKHGSAESARAALVAHMLDPVTSPKLRDDGEVFPNPMPPLEKLFGGTRADAPVLADMLLRLAR